MSTAKDAQGSSLFQAKTQLCAIFSLGSLPDAIATNCSKCTDKQKDGSAKVTHYLIDNQPEEWEQLAKLYDKDGEYKRQYLESKQNGETEAKKVRK